MFPELLFWPRYWNGYFWRKCEFIQDALDKYILRPASFFAEAPSSWDENCHVQNGTIHWERSGCCPVITTSRVVKERFIEVSASVPQGYSDSANCWVRPMRLNSEKTPWLKRSTSQPWINCLKFHRCVFMSWILLDRLQRGGSWVIYRNKSKGNHHSKSIQKRIQKEKRFHILDVWICLYIHRELTSGIDSDGFHRPNCILNLSLCIKQKAQ